MNRLEIDELIVAYMKKHKLDSLNIHCLKNSGKDKIGFKDEFAITFHTEQTKIVENHAHL